MKQHLILTLAIFLCAINLSSQTRVLREEYYENGQLYWKGYDSCITRTDKGRQITYCNNIGTWRYWYENGQLKLEDSNTVSGARMLLNMWTPEGHQLLKNGEGCYYDVDPGREHDDSSVFQIKKMIRQGFYRQYRSYLNGAYFLVESGQYLDGMRTGVWAFRDTILGYSEQSVYSNDKENGAFACYFPNGKLKEDGLKMNGKMEGRWHFYDDQGRRLKVCGYKEGYEFGKYIEYYPGGTTKVMGQYIQRKGMVRGYVEDLNTGKLSRRKIYRDAIPTKDGEWIYFDEKGEVTKRKTYKNKPRRN